LRNFAVDFRVGEDALLEHILRRLLLDRDQVTGWRIVRKGLDARKKSALRHVYSIELSVKDDAACIARCPGDPDVLVVEEERERCFPKVLSGRKIVIAGMGPAGLFAAIRLADYGLRATIVERGRPVEERVGDVRSFWDRGELDPESNVQFGEGGAGTFSDGKLTTRIRDENLGYILRKLVRFGAPREILHLAKPHIGTDRLRLVVRGMREELIARGMEISFSRKLTDIIPRKGRIAGAVLNGRDEVPCDFLVLATGHSARDTYELLDKRAIRLEPKPFAVGVRIEHPQELINRIQYGIPSHPLLPPAEYFLTARDPENGRSVYSFCMCPGGVVMAAASEEGCLVTNGMSFYGRDTGYANSALVAAVDVTDFPSTHPLAGVEFQRIWERKAFASGGRSYFAPSQNLMDFAEGKGQRGIRSSYRPGVVETDLSEVLPRGVASALKSGIRTFDRKMRGFLTREATLTGVETRTSSPVRIVRGDDYQSVSLDGLFPAGEGAGYAGGIMSAALDGIRVADRIAREIQEESRSGL
jgi:uncharacterized FAD-dependent dehydrogenase